MTWWLKFRGGRWTDAAYLDACGEVFALRKQVQRLKDAMEKDGREYIQSRREWQQEKAALIEINHDLAAQWASACGQLHAYGIEVSR